MGCILPLSLFGQRGKIIRTASSTIMDPNRDGFVSKTNSGFSNDGYYVDEFEITMFGIPQIGGDVTGDNVGKSCGITDLTPDNKGRSVYAVRDGGGNLIFRFRVGDDNPSVESWTILLDTDGLFGADDPNSTPNNPGFEIDITLIKRNNAGVNLYNIDGLQNCPAPVRSYSINSNFQISIADEVTCGDPDYFYDFFVPYADLASIFGINVNTGLRFVAVNNVSATCALGGQIGDVAGVNNNDPQYSGCVTCAFTDLVGNQCPTSVVDLCETCGGFEKDKVNAPTIDVPVRAGQAVISGTSDSEIFIVVEIYARTGGTDAAPTWGSTPRETKSNYAVGTIWSVILATPLQAYDKILAKALKTASSVPCGSSGGSLASASVTVVQPNTPPSAQSQTVNVTEDIAKSIVLVGTDFEADPLIYTIVSAPVNGSLSGTIPNLIYTPNLNYNGSDSFTFQVSDGIFSSALPGTVTINVTAVNDSPLAGNQSVTTSEDIAKAITLSATDADGNALTYTIVSSPLQGSLSGSGSNITYTPALNYFGSDNFTFKVNDGTTDSNVATVSITVTPVNDTPVASNQSITTAEDAATAITLVGSDSDGNALTYVIVSGPANGTLSGTGANVTYTPTANYNGVDNFTFKVNDGTTDSNIATVSITVTAVNDAPIANSQSANYFINTPKNITLTGSDPEGDVLTFTVLTSPTNGTLSGAAPNLTYTPDTGFSGGDTFTFKVNDGTTNSNSATVALSVLPGSNIAPVAYPQTVNGTEDISSSITLSATDDNLDALTYIIVASPAHGVLSGTLPNLIYTPAPNYNGPDGFTFKANDGTTDSNIASVTITIASVNELPIADNQSVITPEDIALPIVLSASDPDGASITYSIVSGPSHGVLTGTGSSITYTPASSYNGSDSFTFKVNNGTTDSNTATVFITVTPVADAPIADAQGVTTLEDVSKSINLTGSDPDGDAITFVVVSAPAQGVLNGAAPNLIYTPASNYSGPDSFTFKVNDGTTDSSPATVSITVTSVGESPIANNQSITTPEDLAQAILLIGNDPDGDAITYIIVSGPSKGTLSGAGSTITYTPASDYNGSDSFTFKVNDGTSDSNTATVFITITPVSDSPISFSSNSAAVTVEEVAIPITLIGIDPDGDAITYIIVSNPLHGTLSGTGANVIYTPAANYSGSDSFTFKVNDGTTDSNIATVSITITAVNDSPLAGNQSVTTSEDIAKAITLSATDADGNALTYTIVSPPLQGSLSGSGPNITYTPALNYFGLDNFTFKVNDGITDSNIATVSIVVNPVGDSPIAVSSGSSEVTVEDVATSITLVGIDPDGDALTYIIVTLPLHGTLSGTGADVRYTPEANYSGADSFTFKVNDGTTDSNIATVSITVTPLTDPPIANNQNVATSEDQTKSIALLGVDPDGGILSFIIITQPAHGTLSGSAPSLLYTPASDYNGSDVFTFKVNDGTTDSNIATVSIVINPVGDSPIAVSSSSATVTMEDVATSITLVGIDPDGDALTYIIVTLPLHGTLSGTGADVIYTPEANYSGADSFTFKVNDGTTDSNIATVSIQVTPVNDAPVGEQQSLTTPEDESKTITLTAQDGDSDPLTFIILTQPVNGVLTGTLPNMVYTPKLNYNGSDSFTFKANDGTTDSNITSISITVTPVNDPPVISSLPVLYTKEDSVLQICLNVVDPDGDAIAFGQPTNNIGGGVMIKDVAPYDFCYIFTPVPDYNGESIWILKVSDANGLVGTTSVKIIILPVNDSPIAVLDSVKVLRNVPSTGNVLSNDYDIEGDNLSVTITPVTNVMHGKITLNSDGKFNYISDKTFRGIDSLVYEVCDSGSPSACSRATLIIRVEDISLKVYEGITPNGDGLNDFLRIDGIDFYQNCEVRIFDRFNNIVFEMVGYDNEGKVWRGQAIKGIGNDVLPEGTYFYVVNLGDGSDPINGFVVLKRN